MIKLTSKILIVFLALFLTMPTFAQDNRRLETKVADALAQFPAQKRRSHRQTDGRNSIDRRSRYCPNSVI